MTDPIALAVVAAVPGTLAAMAAFVGVLLGLKNKTAIHEVHLSLNSRLDQLVIAAKHSGRIEEQDKQAKLV